VRTNPADPATETGRTDLMENKATSGSFGPGTTGMTLQQAVFAGLVDPGNLVAVREIVSPAPGTDVGSTDIAVFSDVRANYDCIVGAVITSPCGTTVDPTVNTEVVDARGAGLDGTDTLRNVEALQFADSLPPGTPVIGVAAVVGSGAATVGFSASAGGPVTGFSVQPVNSLTGAPIGAPIAAPAGATTLLVTGLPNGVAVRFKVLATNLFGNSAFSALSNAVTPQAVVPQAPPTPTAVAGNSSATVTWAAPPAGALSSPPVTSYVIVTSPATVGPLTVTAGTATSRAVTGLTNGTAYTFQVRAVNADGSGPLSAASAAVTPSTVPGAPVIGAATSVPVVGTAAGNASALVHFTAPSNGGSAITGFSVRVVNSATNVQVGALRPAAAGTTSLSVSGLVGSVAVKFQVQARNAVGTGAFSALSNAVTPTTVPTAPVIAPANPGTVGGAITARANWTPPASNGGSAVNGYVVIAQRISGAGTVVGTVTSAVQASTTRSLVMTLPAGNYQFTVRARNVLGLGVSSARSNLVTAR